MNLTDITKNIGNTIAKIKNNNELITELNKAYNPTFTEIMEDVKDSDPTLAALLMFWYHKKYSESDLDKLTTNIRKQFGLKDKVKKEIVYTPVSSGGGGCTDNDYSGGCGSSSSRRRTYSYGGCGSSYEDSGHC